MANLEALTFEALQNATLYARSDPVKANYYLDLARLGAQSLSGGDITSRIKDTNKKAGINAPPEDRIPLDEVPSPLRTEDRVQRGSCPKKDLPVAENPLRVPEGHVEFIPGVAFKNATPYGDAQNISYTAAVRLRSDGVGDNEPLPRGDYLVLFSTHMGEGFSPTLADDRLTSLDNLLYLSAKKASGGLRHFVAIPLQKAMDIDYSRLTDEIEIIVRNEKSGHSERQLSRLDFTRSDPLIVPLQHKEKIELINIYLWGCACDKVNVINYITWSQTAIINPTNLLDATSLRLD